MWLILFFGDTMKWKLYADPEVYISDDQYNMKAKSIDDVPNITWEKGVYSNILPEYSVISKRNGEGIERTKRGKIIQKYPIIEIKSGCATACFETSLLDQVLQKTSKLYSAQDNGKLLVKNRNWIFFIASSTFDDVSFEVE